MYFKEKHQVPVGQRDYRVTFWVADYKIDSETVQDSDLLCFNEMKSKANCIEKDNQPMAVWYRYDTRQILFSFDNGTTSYMKNDITGRMRQIE
ncbi:DUF943 family protein [Winslowiella iniecta]|uniref:DUF943 family protein n=1 Tax=Winslowiella iniecta TaxID=1560201 RepID=UPI003B9868C2